MFFRIWRFVTVMLAALTLTMTSAHVLELPQKMQYDVQMYSAANATLYRYFAIVGGSYTVSSILAATVLVFLVRKRGPAFRWTMAGTICLLLAFVLAHAGGAGEQGNSERVISRARVCPGIMDAVARPVGIRVRGRVRHHAYRLRAAGRLPAG